MTGSALSVLVHLSGEALQPSLVSQARERKIVWRTNIVVVSIARRLAGVGLAEVLVKRAAIADIGRTRDGVRELMEGRAATDVARRHGGAATETARRDLVVEDRTVANNASIHSSILRG